MSHYEYIATVMYRPGSTDADISARFMIEWGASCTRTIPVVLSIIGLWLSGSTDTGACAKSVLEGQLCYEY